MGVVWKKLKRQIVEQFALRNKDGRVRVQDFFLLFHNTSFEYSINPRAHAQGELLSQGKLN